MCCHNTWNWSGYRGIRSILIPKLSCLQLTCELFRFRPAGSQLSPGRPAVGTGQVLFCACIHERYSAMASGVAWCSCPSPLLCRHALHMSELLMVPHLGYIRWQHDSLTRASSAACVGFLAPGLCTAGVSIADKQTLRRMHSCTHAVFYFISCTFSAAR